MKFDKTAYFEKTVHFIGIGGVSMSGLASILINEGISVSGSDSQESSITKALAKKGAAIHIGHNNIDIKNISLVVHTAAIPPNNPELLEAKSNNISIMDRASFLGFIMKNYTKNVAVAGTHGKTTTSSMLASIFLHDDIDPTILVGGYVPLLNGNYKIGNSDIFITEACEYKASFLKFNPFAGIILNVDEDHLDYYTDLNEIIETFSLFSESIPKEGLLAVCADDKNTVSCINRASCNIITYGIENGDLIASNIQFNSKGCASFDAIHNSVKLFRVTLGTTGKHNILNALACIAISLFFDVPKQYIINGLQQCTGANKRFEKKGSFSEVEIYDDYAHHPTEIIATLDTIKLIPHKKTIVIFQPHTFTRTKTLFNEFSECFHGSDELILMDIYAARELDCGLVSSMELGSVIRDKGVNCVNVHSHKDAAEYVKLVAQPGDIVITMGAGDVVNVADILLQ